VRPYKCDQCDKAFTQRCSLESHCRKVHSLHYNFAHKERRNKVYVCEDCGYTTSQPELHYSHLKTLHPHSPALQRSNDKRQFKFQTPERVSSERVLSERLLSERVLSHSVRASTDCFHDQHAVDSLESLTETDVNNNNNNNNNNFNNNL